MIFEEAVVLLGRRLGVELYTQEGICQVEVDEMKISIHQIEEIDGFCLLGEIGDLPPLNAEEVMNALLVANYMFKGTGGATISRNPDSGKLYLCLYERLELLDGDRIYEIFGRFVDTLETWCGIVANFKA